MADQEAIIRELASRYDSLPSDKQAIVGELANRFNIDIPSLSGSSAPDPRARMAADVQGKIPHELRGYTDEELAKPSGQFNYKTGMQYTVGQQLHPNGPLTITDAPVDGAKQMWSGVVQASAPGIRSKAGGASKIIRGGMQAASPLLPGAAVAAPLATATALGAGMAAGAVTEGALKDVGVPDEYSELAGDLAGIAAGGKAAKFDITKTPEALEALRSKINAKAEPATTAVAKVTAPIAGKIEDFKSPPATSHAQSAQMMTQALRMSAPKGRMNFQPNMEMSLPAIHEAAKGTPITDLDQLIGPDGRTGLIKDAKAANREKWNKLLGDNEDVLIDGNPIADRMMSSVSDKMKLENPEGVARIKELAGKYRRNFTVEELDNLLQDHNADLSSYYGKHPAARSAALANPDTALTEAQANATRDLLYNALDRDGYGTDATKLQREYGSLSELQEALQKRKNVALRAAPETLSEQLATWNAAKHGVSGFIRAMHGDVVGGVIDVGKGLAEKKVAKWVKEQQSTDKLIERSFRRYTPPPPKAISPFQPKGLLGSGSPGPVTDEPLGSSAGDATDLVPVVHPHTGETIWTPRSAIQGSDMEPAPSGPVSSSQGPTTKGPSRNEAFNWNSRVSVAGSPLQQAPRLVDSLRSAYEPALDKARPGSAPPPDSGSFSQPFSEPGSGSDLSSGKAVSFHSNGQRYTGNVLADNGETLTLSLPGGVIRRVNKSEVYGPGYVRPKPPVDVSTKTTKGIAQNIPLESDGLASPGFPEPSEVIHPKIDRPKVEEFPIGSKVGWKGPNGQKYTVTIESVGDDTLTVRTAGNAKRVINKSDVIKPEKASKGIAQGKRKKK